MEQPPQAPQPPPAPTESKRSSAPAALLAVLVIAGSAIGALIYQLMQSRQKPATDTSGFDIAQVSDQPKGTAAVTSAAPQAQGGAQSSLGMIKSGLQGMQFGTHVASSALRKAEQTFTELCRASEGQVRAMAIRYTRAHPVFQAYGKEWMSYPDLKQLNDNYMRDHDPIAFLRGCADSKNFGAMLKKYGSNPDIQAFSREAMKQAPDGLTSAGMDFLNQDNKVKVMADYVGQALGLPAGMLGGSPDQKIDQNAVLDSVMKSNPQMQQMMGNPDMQKVLSSPDVQKTIKNQSQ